MKFNNLLFDNTPIEFKEINPTDFDNEVYNVAPKQIIEPNEEGYLSEVLLPILESDLEEKNTTVINAGVGQGKTTAIIKLMEKFADNKDYIVVIAVPFKSLIVQYEQECIEKGISKKRIFNLLEIKDYFQKDNESNKVSKSEWGYVDDEKVIEEHANKFNIRNYDIHILTVNALLGNSGESLFQAKEKTEYFNRLLGYCEKKDKKMVVLYDEIHASIHNFKEEFIYKLWNYQGFIHKNYIVSATYNEASKEVIKYLSEFTDNNIKIIESKRVLVNKEPSDLHLHFYTDNLIEKNDSLCEIIADLIDKDKRFDILVYSKKLAQKLLKKDSKIGQLLIDKKIKVNRFYNDPFNENDELQSYEEDSVNIGTKFSTGISIKHKEHTFIVMLPKDLQKKYINNKGVFSMGASSIIQALARQRKKGNIHVFLPPPLDIERSSLPKKYSQEQKDELKRVFEECKSYKSKKVSYSYINDQDKILSKTYNKLYQEIEPALIKIKELNRNSKLNRLLYPTKEIFSLEKGENHLVKDFFGGNLSAYILWASMTNQFLNCRLKDIEIIYKLYLKSENLYQQLDELVKKLLYDIEVIEKEYFYILLKPYEKLCLFKDFIFKPIIILDEEKIGIPKKEKILFDIIKVLFFDSEIISKNEIYTYYLHSCFLYASNFSKSDIEKYRLLKSKVDVIEAFANWNQLKEVIEENIESYKKHTYIDKKSYKAFISKYDEIDFKNGIELLLKIDTLLTTNIFPLKNSYNKEKSPSKRKNIIFNLTVKMFLSKGKKTIAINKKDTSVFIYQPKKIDNIVNLLFTDKETIFL